MAEVISSPSNPKIKRLLALQQKSSERRESGLFVVEGQRELQHCIDAGFEVDTLFVCPSLGGGAPRQNFASLIPPTASQRVPPVHEATGGHGFAGATSAELQGADCVVAETATASGNRSHPRLRKREGPIVRWEGSSEARRFRRQLPAAARRKELTEEVADVHRGRVLDIVASGVEEGVEGEDGAFGENAAVGRPGHRRALGTGEPLERIQADCDRRLLHHPRKSSGICGMRPSEASTSPSTILSIAC